MDMQKELVKWADRTADMYHKLATSDSYPDCNLAFYTQSDLTKIHERPELIILGINPGGYDTKYVDDSNAMVKNQNWINHGVCGRVTGEILRKGNPDFDKRTKWKFWQRLNNILNQGGVESILDDENKFIYTNVVLFNTVKANKIPAKAFDLVSQTVGLIEITQPKRILCLGKNDCFARLEIKDVQELIPNELSVGRFGENDIPIYGIPHTSKYYSREEMDMVGSSLGYLFGREPDLVTLEQLYTQVGHKIEAWKNRPRISTVNEEDFKKLTAGAKLLFGKPYYDNGDTLRYHLSGQSALTITRTEKGYFGIRAAEEYAQRGNWNGALDTDLYMGILKQYDWQSTEKGNWLRIKNIGEFDTPDAALEELKEIKEALEKVSD